MENPPNKPIIGKEVRAPFCHVTGYVPEKITYYPDDDETTCTPIAGLSDY